MIDNSDLGCIPCAIRLSLKIEAFSASTSLLRLLSKIFPIAI